MTWQRCDCKGGLRVSTDASNSAFANLALQDVEAWPPFSQQPLSTTFRLHLPSTPCVYTLVYEPRLQRLHTDPFKHYLHPLVTVSSVKHPSRSTTLERA